MSSNCRVRTGRGFEPCKKITPPSRHGGVAGYQGNGWEHAVPVTGTGRLP
jgi:hypothetical protein